LTFKTLETDIVISDHQFTVISVTNFDELYEQLLSKGMQHEDVADERIPYWAELWPAAVGLSEYIATHAEQIRGKRILEIGCGLGLPSLVAARMGAEVVATDYLADAVLFAKKNAERNGIEKITFKTLDWRKAAGEGPYDVLMASDVAYERSQFEHLLKSFETLVTKDGLTLLSEPNRYIAKPFIENIKERGYSLHKSNIEVTVRAIKSKVSVYALMSTKQSVR
jgi:predicted nicotinamide N-methyase